MTDEGHHHVEEDYGFVERQLALLGTQDPLDVLRNTPGEAAALFGRSAPEQQNEPWAPGKWTPLEILAHLSLTEWVFGYRTRVLLCDPTPVLHPIEQERWLDRCGTGIGDAADHIQDFAGLRRANLRTWCSLTEEELERTAYHEGAGRDMSLGFLLRLLAGHDLNHLGQIRTALAPPP